MAPRMTTATPSAAAPLAPGAWMSRRRILTVAGVALAVGLLVLPLWRNTALVLFLRCFFVAFFAAFVFGLFERWPRRLPRWLPRWTLQIAGVALAMPVGLFLIYSASAYGLSPPWWRQREYQGGFAMLLVIGILLSPWIAFTALLHQISGAAQRQALTFELERARYERQALDGELRLLQAQVEPHFLFNTLANVRELVEAGSPQASQVLASLIAYLRAAVPRLQARLAPMSDELDLVRAYLEVMHMRMPDRLRFSIEADAEALRGQCPPSALLTLVENALRHGIDPSEEGGAIELRVVARDGRCRATVTDTGVGLRPTGAAPAEGLGTGLSTLRERLRLLYAGQARLELSANQPRGVRAELDLPARWPAS